MLHSSRYAYEYGAISNGWDDQNQEGEKVENTSDGPECNFNDDENSATANHERKVGRNPHPHLSPSPRRKRIDPFHLSLPSAYHRYILALCLTLWLSTLSWFISYVIRVGGGLLRFDRNEEEYEYIVVGAGPAGIIVAVSLARKLLEAEMHTHQHRSGAGAGTGAGKVLLLESGTLSQGSVERSPLFDTPDGVLNSNDSQVQNQNQNQNQSPFINEFDIPIMWNNCNSKENGDDGMRRFLSHHWPVEGTLVGRAVGGSGLHNAMINVRALPDDFKKWNVSKWSAEEVIPYFDRLETYVTNVTAKNLGFWGDMEVSSSASSVKRGMSGPLSTSPANDDVVSPIAKPFIESSLAAGLPLASLGFNDPDVSKRVGVGFYELNIRNGIRDSVAKAFLTSRASRRRATNNDNLERVENMIPPNLVLQRDATVQNIDFNTDSQSSLPSAIGVTYYSSSNGQTQQARLRHSNYSRRVGGERVGSSNINRGRSPEVILSAGAIFSPQILANSGIHEGGWLVDSQGVGKNLQDHPVVALAFEINDGFGTDISSYFSGSDTTGDPNAGFLAYLDAINADGLFEVTDEHREKSTSSSSHSYQETISQRSRVYGTPGFSVGAFLVSPWSLEDGIPDIQMTVFPTIKEPHFTMMNKDDLGFDVGSDRMIMITVALLRPEARSVLKFASPHQPHKEVDEDPLMYDPRTSFEEYFQFGTPDIVDQSPDDENVGGSYLTKQDVDRLSWGIEEVRRIMSTEPISSNITAEVFPGAQIRDLELKNFINKNVMRNSHWCGSTRMGDDKSENVADEQSVVDEKLRVRGVLQTRVIDAGVMPFVPNGNTHATTCVVAMRGADLIFEDQ